jgi:predicted HAD superfamily phosphohydrolase YqeG
VSSVGSKQ